MSRRFTLSEAETLIPEIDRLIREAVARKIDYQEAEQALQAFGQKVMLSGGLAVDRERILSVRSRRDTSGAALKNAIESIHGFGCLVKDLDLGLVDFPTLYRGQEVLLCWRMGEPRIEFWHGMEEGFAGRKQIDQDFLDNHQGDQAH